MNPFIRPTRSLLTCKNKSNIFHYVLLGLYNAATTVVCFQNVTSHNGSYCFLAWFPFPMFLSSQGLHCLFHCLCLCIRTHPVTKSTPEFYVQPLLWHNSIVTVSLFCLTCSAHLWHFSQLIPHSLSLPWPVSVPPANWELQPSETQSSIWNLLDRLVWQIV